MGWYEAIKDALAAADRLRDAELKQRLADVQMECAKLAEDNARLRQELIDLREQSRTRQEMHYQENVYWRRSGQDKLEGPYCPKCLDGDNKAARMTDQPGVNWWTCPVCSCGIAKPGRGSLGGSFAREDYDPLSG
jgi:hypothetical protein